MKKIAVIFGTRPEAIKLCPVILELKKHPEFDCHVCVTGQHREMLDQVLHVFGVIPDVDLKLMRPDQTLGGLTARAIEAIDKYLTIENPDAVIVQGDTTTVFCAALAAFYHHIPVAHVEAGLRTWNMFSPWPEEANRVLTTRLAHWHFAPTERNRQNLLKEGVSDTQIYVVGNTVIDALFYAREKVQQQMPPIVGLPDDSLSSLGTGRMVLITGHRRENFGDGFEHICHAIYNLAKENGDINFVYPVHLNPHVREPINRILRVGSREALPNIHLIGPQPYLAFVALMNRASLILTDSGGVQEEAPSLGKPILVMRDTTERPEAVQTGAARLVGTACDGIMEVASDLLKGDPSEAQVLPGNPYGDGHSSSRIAVTLGQTV